MTGPWRMPSRWIWTGLVCLITGVVLGGVAAWISPSLWAVPLRIVSFALISGTVCFAVIGHRLSRELERRGR